MRLKLHPFIKGYQCKFLPAYIIRFFLKYPVVACKTLFFSEGILDHFMY